MIQIIHKFCSYRYQQHNTAHIQKTTNPEYVLTILSTQFAHNGSQYSVTTKAANGKQFIDIPIIREKGVQFRS